GLGRPGPGPRARPHRRGHRSRRLREEAVKGVAALIVLSALLLSCSARSRSAFENPAFGPVTPPPVFREADLEEHLGRRLDPSLAFTDADGRSVHLGDYLR